MQKDDQVSQAAKFLIFQLLDGMVIIIIPLMYMEVMQIPQAAIMVQMDHGAVEVAAGERLVQMVLVVK